MGTDGAARGRRARLSASRDFDAVYRKGRSFSDRNLVVYVFPCERGESGPRLGVSVSRKVGGAVERNRIKRAPREQFAAHRDLVPDSTDVVVIARRGLVEFLDEHGGAAVGERLAALLERGARAMADPAVPA